MADDLAQDVIEQWEREKAEKSVYDFHCQEIADLVLPNRNDFIVERVPGQKRMRKIFTEHPVWCNRQYAAGMHALATSPTLPWFALWTEDDRINTVARVRQWLQAAARAMYGRFSSPRHNFAAGVGELWLDHGAFGQACMFVLETPRTDALFSTRHMKEMVFVENDEDRIDGAIRNWKYTAKQATQAWGKAAGEKVAKAAGDPKTAGQKFQFIHAVRPRKKRLEGHSDARNKAWESVYVSVEDKSVIKLGGFDEFPCLAPRAVRRSGETYGVGCGADALPLVKQLNEMEKTLIKAAQKIVDPPIQLPDDGYLLPLDTTPGGKLFYRAGLRPTDRAQPLETRGNIPIGEDAIARREERLKQIWYVDLLRLPVDPQDPGSAGKDVTATFWSLYQSKEFLALSPMLSRVNMEFTGPLIDRVFNMLWRRSVRMGFGPGAPFPPPPPELSGQRLRVEYLSPIAIAQKTSELSSVEQLINRQMLLRNIDPQSEIILDEEGIMRGTADDLNAPAWALKTPERLAAERQAKAEAAQAMNAHNEILSTAGAAKDGSAALKNLADAARGQGQQQTQEAA